MINDGGSRDFWHRWFQRLRSDLPDLIKAMGRPTKDAPKPLERTMKAPPIVLTLILILSLPGAVNAEPADASMTISNASVEASGLMLEGLGLVGEAGSTLVVGTVTVAASAATVVLLTPSAATAGVITVSTEMGEWLKTQHGRELDRRTVRGGTALTLDQRVVAFVPDANTRKLMHREQVAP